MIKKGANQAGGSALTGDWQPLQAAAQPKPEPEPTPAPATESQQPPPRLLLYHQTLSRHRTCHQLYTFAPHLHIVVSMLQQQWRMDPYVMNHFRVG